LADGEDKGKDETLTGRMVNQKDLLQMEIEVMQAETIEGNRDVSDAAKRAISKETAWQKTFICTMRRKMMKMLT